MKYRIIRKVDGNDTEYFIVQYNDFLPLPLWFSKKQYTSEVIFGRRQTEEIRHYDYDDALRDVEREKREQRRAKTKKREIVYRDN